jgi:hypothetical protein
MKAGDGVGVGLGDSDGAVPHPVILQRRMSVHGMAMLFLKVCVNSGIFSSFP